jgi:hypothetical protein
MDVSRLPRVPPAAEIVETSAERLARVSPADSQDRLVVGAA